MTAEYRNRDKKTYSKNVIGISGIIFLIGYILVNIRTGLFLMGAFLLAEHIYEWAGFHAKDLIGHEYLGALLMIFSANNWFVTFVVILICIVNADLSVPWSSELVKFKNLLSQYKLW